MPPKHRIGDVVQVVNNRSGVAEHHVVISEKKRKRLEYKMYAIVPVGSEMNLLPLLDRIGKNIADLRVWFGLVSALSPTTGLALTSLDTLAGDIASDKSNTAKALKRLQSADLIRYCDGCIFNKKTGETASGWILNPDFVVIVEHPRARHLWMQAGQQLQEKDLIGLVRKVDKMVSDGMEPLDAADVLTGDNYDRSLDILSKRDEIRRNAEGNIPLRKAA